MARIEPATILSALTLTFLVGSPIGRATETGFDHICSWTAFDPGEHGIGEHPDGYWGAAFDGRYVYYAPYRASSTEYHGEVLRYDTYGDFSDVASWLPFDAGDHGVGIDPDGYAGTVFDGRFVYFVPWRRSSGYHGEVLRYDTAGEFATASSWAAFDPGAQGLGRDPDGYRGATFDGQYVYFAPCYTGDFHGEVLRLDTTGDFSDLSAWRAYDPGNHGVGVDPDGYSYPVFDGRYVYFGPYHNGTEYHGEVLRYDTTAGFREAASWATYDPGSHGVGTDPDGYLGTVFDGRYIYFAPYDNGSGHHGEVLRYDTAGAFDDVASWTTFDAVAQGVGVNPTGYCEVVFDGRFIYFVPVSNATGNHDEILRYDTAGSFADVDSWTTFEPGEQGVAGQDLGYRGGTFDGHHVYFVAGGLDPAHGEALRFDAITCPGDIDHDGAVDLADLAELLGHYHLTSGATCADGDLDGDGDVDLSDLAALLAVYESACH